MLATICGLLLLVACRPCRVDHVLRRVVGHPQALTAELMLGQFFDALFAGGGVND
jgi:hypothetical protein